MNLQKFYKTLKKKQLKTVNFHICLVYNPLFQEKEEVFRQISEDTNSKVLWWAVVQTLILLSVGFWQIKRLKDFFIAKKLV